MLLVNCELDEDESHGGSNEAEADTPAVVMSFQRWHVGSRRCDSRFCVRGGVLDWKACGLDRPECVAETFNHCTAAAFHFVCSAVHDYECGVEEK